MENYELCILGANRIKKLFLFFGFSFLIVCIIFGSYGDQHAVKQSSPQRQGGGLRRILELGYDEDDPQDAFDPNGTNEDIECSSIHDYNSSLYCEFVRNVPSCGGDDGFIPYFDFLYCSMPVSLIPLSMIILTLWLFYLFLFLGTTAESFFCRELAYITKLLRLSQNVAGVTLLAIGNGAPDIFSAIAAFNHPDPKKSSLAFGALFGAGMFVTNIVVGLVCIFRPFRLTRRPFLRDNVYYLFATYWILFLLWDNKMSLWQAIGLLIFYISYVLVVILGSIVYQKWIQWRAKKQGNSQAQQTERVEFKKERQVDSMGESQIGKVTIDSSESSSDELIKKTDRGKDTLPTVVITKTDNNSHSDSDSGSSRPMTPSEKSASKASKRIYRASDQGELVRRVGTPRRDLEEDRGETPRPRSRLEQVIDSAMNVAEDVIASSNPNLAKLWHTEYDREMKMEQQAGGRSTTPYFSTTAITPTIDEETSFQARAQKFSSMEEKDTNIDLTHSQKPPTEDTPLLSSASSPEPQPIKPLRKLLNAIFPFVSSSYKSSSIFSKIFQIVKYPLTLVLTLTIPVLDIDEPMNNWNKWLVVLQCVTAPLFISLATEFGLELIGGVFPVIVIVFAVSLILALVVALTSSSDKPPIYHCVFAWVGFVLSIIWIYTIANEIVNVLQVFGVVVKLSDGILGLTLLAWGNSIQDSVTNVTMARQGFPRMAVGACFGGPLLNILIGIGLASIIRVANSDEGDSFTIYLTQVTFLAGCFLILSLIISLVFASGLQFEMYKFYGLFLFLFYLSFLVIAILAELNVFTIKIDGVLSVID